MIRAVHISFLLALVALLFPRASGQGETTSAIVGQVSDASNAAIPGALTYTTSPPTGLLGVGLGGDSSPRMIAFQARLEFGRLTVRCAIPSQTHYTRTGLINGLGKARGWEGHGFQPCRWGRE